MLMFETSSILPHNSTPFEKRLEQAANFPHLPIAELADLINPWEIDSRYLAFLAYRFSIEIWRDDWTEEKKRSVIARALELQRIKGTQRGLREYVKLVDASVKQIMPYKIMADKAKALFDLHPFSHKINANLR